MGEEEYGFYLCKGNARKKLRNVHNHDAKARIVAQKLTVVIS
jgi:hypothetical protein